MDTKIQSVKYTSMWALLGLGFVLCYYPTFKWLNYKFSTPDSYYSHGYLIPLVVLYLIYDKRTALKGISFSSNKAGLFFAVFALMIHAMGVLSNINFISGFTIILYLAGCSLFIFGGPLTKQILFPLAYLALMMPIPDEYLGVVALPFKSLATWSALTIIDLSGIPYIREGFSISLATGTFIVGTPCNGLRSLISFLALGLAFIYFMSMTVWRGVFLLCIIPIMAIVLNGLRIAILLLISTYYGQDAASSESVLHDGSGLLVFFLGMVIFILYSKAMHEKRSN